MTSIILTIHIIVAIALIGVVLIQRGQGADIGASFGGGGAQTLFGSRGSGSFLGKLTGGLAATFMVTSLTLAFFTQQDAGSLVERSAPIQQPLLPSSDAESTVNNFDASQMMKEAGTGGTQSNANTSVEIPVAGGDAGSELPAADVSSEGAATDNKLPGADGK